MRERLKNKRLQALIEKKLVVIEDLSNESDHDIKSPGNLFASFFVKNKEHRPE